MRIKQIQIDRYGPLNQIYLQISPGVQTIYGDNESGKTLLVDAMIKQLTGDRLSDASLNRVTESPEGYIILEDKGDEYKIDRENDLSKYLQIEPDEIRNIFVIRNSDLEIPDEPRFYERTYQRLTGLRTDDIRIITDKIKNIGRLTDGLSLKNSNPYNYPATNVENAKRLRRQIDEYLDETSQQGIDQIESELYKDKSRKEELDQELETQQKSKELAEYWTLESALKDLEQANKEHIELPSNEEIYSVNQKINNYLEKENTRPLIERTGNLSKTAFYVLLIATFVSWALGVSNNPSILGYIIPIFFAVGAMVSGYLLFSNSRKISVIDSLKLVALSESKKIGIKQEDFDEIQSKIGEIRETIGKTSRRVHQNIGVLRKRFNITEENPEQVIDRAKVSLTNLGKTLDFTVEFEYDQSVEQQLQAELKELYEKIEENNGSLTDHRDNLSTFSKDANELDFKSFMGRPLNILVNSLESLRLLKQEFNEFIETIESNAVCAKIAARIFQELESEEEEKITDLFSEDNETSKLFSKLSKGRYSKVFYDNSVKKIFVERPSGQKIEAFKLSKGAYDQLYFAIRVDLAQRMLEGRSAFMILDDAFLTSGTTRFEEGIDIMKELTKKGWNLLYLTVKDIDAEKISQAMGIDLLKLQPLP